VQRESVGLSLGDTERGSYHSAHSRNHEGGEPGSNIGALGVKLTEEEIKALEDAVPAEEVAGTRYGAHSLKSTWQNAKSPPLSSWTGSVSA